MRSPLSVNFFLSALLVGSLMSTAACKKDKKDNPAPVPPPMNVMTYKLNGTRMSASVSTQRSGTDLAMTGLTGSGSAGTALYVGLGTVTDTVTLDSVVLVYSEGSVSWSSSPVLPGVASRVRITAYDTTAHSMSGMFTATLAPQTGTGAMGTKTITEGVFTNVKFP